MHDPLGLASHAEPSCHAPDDGNFSDKGSPARPRAGRGCPSFQLVEIGPSDAGEDR